ncbi:MAG: RNA polymerase sigma factor [Bryobacteraceae bacterium]|jgi:RNA polymerase sigma-70 factor (ECF subfamily)
MEPAIQAQLEDGHLNAAFDLVVEHYQHRVYRLALAILGDPAAAQDAAQEAFLRIWKGLGGFRGQSALSTWIYAIARNTALTERKSAAMRPTLPLDNAVAAGGRVASTAPSRAGFDVAALVSRLRPQYQQVIRLYYMEENSYEEVARMLDIPLGTVKTLLHRARIELVAALARSTVREG